MTTLRNDEGYEIVSETMAHDSYDEALDTYGEVKIGNLTFDASKVLKECDPIAYRVGFNDYCDSQEWEVVSDKKYDDLQDQELESAE